jgi:hypothetical protein
VERDPAKRAKRVVVNPARGAAAVQRVPRAQNPQKGVNVMRRAVNPAKVPKAEKARATYFLDLP